MCDFPRKLCPDGGAVCPCTVFGALFERKYSEVAQLLRDHPQVLEKVVATGEPCVTVTDAPVTVTHGMSFGLYVITRLPARLLNLALDSGFKEVADVVLDTLRPHPQSYQEYRMMWALASEWQGECLWEHEYIDAINSGDVPIARKHFLQPRSTSAMIAAWEAWTTTDRDRERDRVEREREEQWRQQPRVLRMPPSHALAKRK